MFRPRVIPVLLLQDLGLVKTVKFKSPRYIGDPINAVKLFNDLKADELVFLDIMASKNCTHISTEFVKKVGHEANMPFAVGGGISSLKAIYALLRNGAEKVVLNTSAILNPNFIEQAAKEFGSSTIVVSMDVKTTILKKEKIYIKGGTQKTKYSPIEFAKLAEDKGAGELIVNSISRDGTMLGYDNELIKSVSVSVKIPVVALGGAANLGDFQSASHKGFASAVAAGSMFVYHGPRNAVLINYPSRDKLKKLFKNEDIS